MSAFEIYWRFAGALILVVALIFAVAWVAKRLGVGGRMVGGRGKRRLSVQEVLSLDGKRRLVLVKRDNVEHLLLFGLHDDRVVETGIVPPAGTLTADKPVPEFGSLLAGPRP